MFSNDVCTVQYEGMIFKTRRGAYFWCMSCMISMQIDMRVQNIANKHSSLLHCLLKFCNLWSRLEVLPKLNNTAFGVFFFLSPESTFNRLSWRLKINDPHPNEHITVTQNSSKPRFVNTRSQWTDDTGRLITLSVFSHFVELKGLSLAATYPRIHTSDWRVAHVARGPSLVAK